MFEGQMSVRATRVCAAAAARWTRPVHPSHTSDRLVAGLSGISSLLLHGASEETVPTPRYCPLVIISESLRSQLECKYQIILTQTSFSSGEDVAVCPGCFVNASQTVVNLGDFSELRENATEEGLTDDVRQHKARPAAPVPYLGGCRRAPGSGRWCRRRRAAPAPTSPQPRALVGVVALRHIAIRALTRHPYAALRRPALSASAAPTGRSRWGPALHRSAQWAAAVKAAGSAKGAGVL
ncbi:hypothetical protein EVAR_31747_1 [Eumeta japonica]|uniref:Uncharacterized protein n=1 Tax=Eumeta variegata TaxID=151549 RepID=A0A4C1W4B8_EUMVA|nr:hypothetical protein EVAR_31747_1 [Eumeta japonica]